MNHYDVIVIGLGPSGSMAALMLESYGIKVLCIDKEKEIYKNILDKFPDAKLINVTSKNKGD